MEKLKTLKELVNINSSENCNQIVDYIKDTLQGLVEEICVGDNKEFVIVGVNTKLKNIKPIVLSGHIDTVSPVDIDKLDLKIKDDRAYGLGVIDMKCFTATIIDNIHKIKQLDYPVICVFTTDEETKLETIVKSIQKLIALNIEPQFSVIGEPSGMNFATRSKGCSEYSIDVVGKPCHSSKPQNGVNAIYIIAKIISFIEQLFSSFKETTLNCGIVSGGDIVNRVAGNAKLEFDIRTYNEQEKLFALTEIENYLKTLEQEYAGSQIFIENKLEIPSFSLKNTKLIQNLSNKFKNEIIDFTGGCEAGYLTSYSGDAVIYGVGDISLCHQINENIVISEYLEYQNKFMQLLTKIKDSLKINDNTNFTTKNKPMQKI